MSDVTAAAPEQAEPKAPTPKRIDLDAARRARREKQGPAPEIVFFGNAYPLPRSLPAKVIDLVASINAGDWSVVIEAMRILLGGPVYDQIIEKAEAEGDPLELEDVTFLLEQALEVYEVTLPESNASGPWSSATGPSSRPTSPATTS